MTARPPSVAYRFQKALRRNKLAFGTGAAVVAALVVGLAAAAVGWRQTGIERDKALQAQQRAETSQQSEKEQRQRAEAERQRAETERQRAERGEADSRLLLYAANMNLAQQAWEQNNGIRLRQLLEETKESGNRNFEWYYWQRQAHLELKTLRGHLGPVDSAAFSPDGQRIVTGSMDQTAKVWDSASPNQVAAWQAEEHAAEQRLAQLRAAEASENPESQQP